MMNYEFSNKGKAFLITLEGICLSPYLDSVGVKTLGIGSTISDIPNIDDLPWDYTLTIEQALEQMNTGLKKYVDAVNSVLQVPVTQNQFDALVAITYNIGTGKVKSRVGGMAGSTFMKRINAKYKVGAVPMRMLEDRWDVSWITDPSIIYEEELVYGFTSGGTIVDAILMWNKPSEIIGRRRKEAQLFASGNYGEGRAQLFPVNHITHKPMYNKSKIINIMEYVNV